MDLGVRMPNDGTNNNLMPYVQNFTIATANWTHEVQVLKFTGNGVAPGGKFRFAYGTKVSGLIPLDPVTKTFDCAAILNQTNYLGIEPITCVNYACGTHMICMNITFVSMSQNRPKFTADVTVLTPVGKVSFSCTKYPGTAPIMGSY
jgi:hypothetical protein